MKAKLIKRAALDTVAAAQPLHAQKMQCNHGHELATCRKCWRPSADARQSFNSLFKPASEEVSR